MAPNFIISAYINRAMRSAEHDKLEDGSFAGRIGCCQGVVAHGKTLAGCEEELRSALEDWLLLGFKLGHRWSVWLSN